jgi:PleD family two-component response regulator
MVPNPKPKILLADDSRVIREAIKRFLLDEYEVHAVEDGLQAWETLTADPSYDLIISDISMPNLDGYSLICRIRDANQSYSHIPIIVITGLDDEIVRIRAFACGADNFIPKPLDKETLKTNLRLQLTEHQQMQEGGIEAAPVKLFTPEQMQAHGSRAVQQALATGESLSLIRIKLMSLDKIEVDYGAENKANVSAWFTQLLWQRRRSQDVLACTADDVYTLLLPATSRQNAMVLAERIYSAMASEPFPDANIARLLTPQMGYATLGDGGSQNYVELLAVAEHNRLHQSQIVALSLDDSMVEQPDLEQALNLIEQGEAGRLLPYAADLAKRVMPLLMSCSEQLGLGLELEIEAIHSRLAELP